MMISFLLALPFIIIVGMKQGKLSRLSLKHTDTIEKQRFMEWRNLELKAANWLLCGFLVLAFSGLYHSIVFGVIFLILSTIPVMIFRRQSEKIRRELGFTVSDALRKKVFFV